MSDPVIEFTKSDRTDFNAKLCEIARRLGVEPVDLNDGVFRSVLRAGDACFDVQELVIGLLNKLDAASEGAQS